MGKFAALVLSLLALPLALSAAEPAAGVPEAAAPLQWENWHAGNNVADLQSLQRGARNFMNYCIGCHSLKYLRYQRMGDDLDIPTAELNADLVAPGSTNLDYITTSMPAADAANWFGKTPPDLSLIARSRSPDYIYRFLKPDQSIRSFPDYLARQRDGRTIRWLRARYRQLPRLCGRPGAGRAAIDRPVGSAVPAAAVGIRLGAEERVLERRALTVQAVRPDLNARSKRCFRRGELTRV
jgi:hypothetical protein